MKERIVFYTIIGIFLFSFFLYGYVMGERYGYSFENNNPIKSSEVLNNKCSNLSSLEATSKCLVKELSEFYNYNESNSYLYWNNGRPKIEDWDKIKEEGGVCWHYAEWYVMRAKELGFIGGMIIVDYEPISHAIALLTNNKDEYCVIDQRSLVGCGKTEVPDEN